MKLSITIVFAACVALASCASFDVPKTTDQAKEMMNKVGASLKAGGQDLVNKFCANQLEDVKKSQQQLSFLQAQHAKLTEEYDDVGKENDWLNQKLKVIIEIVKQERPNFPVSDESSSDGVVAVPAQNDIGK